jgi:hypothetical protein
MGLIGATTAQESQLLKLDKKYQTGRNLFPTQATNSYQPV